jgi:hypothetical protein
MEDPLDNLTPIRTLWQHFRAGIKRAHDNRPVSFYLLLTMPVVLLLGVQLASAHHNPRKFFLFLTLLFTFFIVVLSRALLDFIEITRKHLADEKQIFRSTLAEPQFLATLKKRACAQTPELPPDNQ